MKGYPGGTCKRSVTARSARSHGCDAAGPQASHWSRQNTARSWHRRGRQTAFHPRCQALHPTAGIQPRPKHRAALRSALHSHLCWRQCARTHRSAASAVVCCRKAGCERFRIRLAVCIEQQCRRMPFSHNPAHRVIHPRRSIHRQEEGRLPARALQRIQNIRRMVFGAP